MHTGIQIDENSWRHVTSTSHSEAMSMLKINNSALLWYQDPFLCHIALWPLSVSLSGTYRLSGGNHCTHYNVASEESQVLQDGDTATCESLYSPANAMFGIFFKEPWCRTVVITIYGHEIRCNPVDGVRVVVVSNNYQRYGCKAFATQNEDMCKYQCPMNGHTAMIITFPSIRSETSRICETRLSLLL